MNTALIAALMASQTRIPDGLPAWVYILMIIFYGASFLTILGGAIWLLIDLIRNP